MKNRESGYYWIRVNEDDDWIIGYWNEGAADASGEKSTGYFDVSNHWCSEDQVFSPHEIGERVTRQPPMPLRKVDITRLSRMARHIEEDEKRLKHQYGDSIVAGSTRAVNLNNLETIRRILRAIDETKGR